jgi:methyl-accepting chemotaxis protein
MIFTSAAEKETQALLAALDKSQAVIHFSLDGTILWANQNFLATLGYSLDEIQGKHHRLFVETEDAASDDYKNFWADLGKGKYQAAEYKRVGKGGKEIWIQATYNPILDKNGKLIKIVKYATDITARVLEAAEMKGQVSAIGKSQAVIHFDLNGYIQWANENFLGATGYTLGEIQGKHHRMFVEHAYGQSAEYREFWEDLNKGKFQSNEYKRVGKGGKEVWIQASYNPIFDPTGKVFKVVKYATDITAQVKKRAETNRIGNLVDNNLGEIVEAVGNASMQSAAASSASSQAAETVHSVASAAEELTSSIREISQNIILSASEVDTAIQHMQDADQSTGKLSETAKQMSGIVQIIQDIASQINLLALNATIEAARAGDAGKGFAVVAGEVKTLARQVAQATDKISDEIAGIQSVSGDVVTSLATIKHSVEAIRNSVNGVAGAIEEQSAVTLEISNNMQTASLACGDVDTNLKKILGSIEVSNSLAMQGQTMYQELRALQ